MFQTIPHDSRALRFRGIARRTRHAAVFCAAIVTVFILDGCMAVIPDEHVTVPRAYAWSMWIAIILLAGVVVALVITMARRRSAEDALRDSEQRFRLLAENVPGVIYLCRNDARYTMLYLSDEVERLTGYPASEFLGDRISFVELYHPDDAEAIAPEVERALDARRSFRLEYRLRRRDGTYVWIEENGVGVFGPDGDLQYLEGHLANISWRKENDERQRLMMAELDHRVKNNLATLSSIVHLTMNATSSPEEFEQALVGRIQAMAQAHDLFAQHRWGDVPIVDIIMRTLAPFHAEERLRISTSGAIIELPTARAQNICMIMHELATNAAKYGALSHPDGRVDIDISDEGEDLRITWIESGGPPASPPEQSGFGLSMIQGVVKHDLRGKVCFCFESEGARCTLELPTSVLMNDQSRHIDTAPDDSGPEAARNGG